MNAPIYAGWVKGPLNAPALTLSVEKEASFDQVYKEGDWKKKLLMKVVKLVGYTPQLAFQKEDVNMDIVKKILEHKEALAVVDEWISNTDYELLPKLVEAKKVFDAIQKPKSYPLLYRGFKINPGQQDSGIAERYKNMKEGDKWSYTPDKPMSFSWHKGTSEVYGNIIVSVDYAKVVPRCLNITHEMVMALFHDEGEWNQAEDYYMFTYAESVFLPDKKPLEFTLVSKG